MGAGCVFTGGGAHLAGLLDNAESLLRVPARIGYPVPLVEDAFGTGEAGVCGVAIGMLLYTHRTQVRKASEEQGLKTEAARRSFAGSLSRLRDG